MPGVLFQRLVCDPGSAAGVDTGMISKLVQRVLFTSQVHSYVHSNHVFSIKMENLRIPVSYGQVFLLYFYIAEFLSISEAVRLCQVSHS